MFILHKRNAICFQLRKHYIYIIRYTLCRKRFSNEKEKENCVAYTKVVQKVPDITTPNYFTLALFIDKIHKINLTTKLF